MIEEYIKPLLESFKRNQISKLIEQIDAKFFKFIYSKHVNPRILPYFPRTQWAPFSDYNLDPDTISQIKKFLNALYYARQTFLDLEQVDIKKNGKFNELRFLYEKTIDSSYEASYLATHLDVDLRELFQEELNILLPLLHQIQSSAEHIARENKEVLVKTLKPAALAYKAGEVAGIAVDQMRPPGSDVDYNFLTQFSAVLPSYIDKLTLYIKKFSTQIKESEPKLNKKKLDELQNAALNLLNDIEHLKGSKLFISVKFLNYIHIIRNIITLSTSSLEQIGELSESTQDLVREKLARLKYTLLPTLFGLLDEIEDNLMLKPGMLSLPFMEKVKLWYEALLFLPKKAVNFKAKGEELLAIEDSQFIELRLKQTYKRIDKSNTALYKIQKAREASEHFFALLNNPLYKDSRLFKLPLEVKNELITHYKLIKPYMTKLDIDLNQEIIEKITGPEVENWSSYLSKPWRYIRNQVPSDHISIVLAKQKELHDLITKDENSQLFHINLNKDLIESVHKQANLVLFPYNEKTNRYSLLESIPLEEEKQLTALQAMELYQGYKNTHDKFLVIKNAYVQFKEMIDTNSKESLLLSVIDPKIKDRCRTLYSMFQPYFMSAVPPEMKEDALKFDKFWVSLLSNKKINKKKVPSIKLFQTLDDQVQTYFERIDIEWSRRIQISKDLAQKQFVSEHAESELKQTPANSRAHYVLTHTLYSTSIHEFRQSLFATIKVFNKTIQKEFIPQIWVKGVPFPEMEDPDKRLAQSKYVCALKDLFNSVYHLEGIALELEELNNKNFKSIYVSHLLQAYSHLNEIIQASQHLISDPHMGFIAKDLLDKAQTLYATLQEHSNAYQLSPEQVPYGPKNVQYNPLWYVLNAFYISPTHIRALNHTNYLTTEELNALHLRSKKATLFIEQVINNSDSYFKLFLQTPNMVYLYQELSRKLNEFTNASHDLVLNNLNKMRAKIFTPMLLQADQWENRLGLIPGNLSGPLSQIIDEFYKGLLHPLDLPSYTRIALICDKNPLILRTHITECCIKKTSKYLKRIDREYNDIKELYQSLQKYKQYTQNLIPASEFLLELTKHEIQVHYKKALPKLARLKLDKKVEVAPSKYPEDHQFDDLCNASLKEYDLHFTEVEGLINASYHYCLGLKATHQMQLSIAEEKLEYLTELASIQNKEHIAFIEQYTTESFNKHLEVFCNRHIGLYHTDKEYRTKLNEHLLQFKNEIIAQSKTALDINISIKTKLKEQMSDFEKKNYAKFYHLDTVKAALAQFKIYFNNATAAIQNNESLFENEHTLNEKTQRIKNLDTIAENEQLSVVERLRQINNQVHDPNFSRIILAQKHTDTFFSYLKMAFLSLLEALHLYLPSRKKILNTLNDSIDKSPEISELTKRFGLFSKTPQIKDPEAKRYDPPNLPEMQPK